MLEKKIGQTGMGDIVLRCNGKRASPERFAITPIAVLNPGRPREGGNYYRLSGDPRTKHKVAVQRTATLLPASRGP
jgi:hypothetical protein